MNRINTRKALNPAYRKHKPVRKDVNSFVEQLKDCLVTIKLSDEQNESEEHIKEPIKKFLQGTFYQDHLINTKDRIDLAIYTGENVKSDVGVLIEAKRPSNKAEFLTPNSLNRKALQELLLYYLRERLECENNSIKHLIATNGYEWFLFKSEDFYKYFFKNKDLIKEYNDFKDGLKDSTKNELFYKEIASKYIEEVEQELPFVYLNFTKSKFSEYSDANLNTLFKIFSPVHILGSSFGNDSNELNKTFYNELLYIIGLEEIKEKGKKVIYRRAEKDRDYASILENTIFTLEDKDYLDKVKSVVSEDKAFDAGLELCLSWVNRILFLKLLESQLLTYHKGAKEYKFLNSEFIKGFDDLNDLFFSALAKKQNERHPKFKDKFQYIPYLNSSLFERNELETETFEISALNDDQIEVFSSTVLKEPNGKRFKGKLNTVDYLFKFLDAYDFATDGTEGISDEVESKSLINASVLGLIFEKINGYKEGSFYTPAYITMYMCKDTIRRAVVQKFKENENDQIESFDDLKAYCHKYFKPENIIRFNEVVNSLRICDPAVGSGHFLVSALNEIIAIKNELGILVDAKGFALKCDIHIESDELYITDAQGFLFEYNPNDIESVRVQHTLFSEKQVIIENCLFGVDINPNSVKICRLRLWIELLKNAYYTKDKQLKTLPNIDINIKCGNSLVYRFELDDDLKDAFNGKDVKYSFKDYREAVAQYKGTNDKDVKRDVLKIINEVKYNFKSTLDKKVVLKTQIATGEYKNEKLRIDNLKQFEEQISKADKDNLNKLKKKSEKSLLEKEEIINNVIYEDAFEWRFEFPEVLNKSGEYVGFDVIIGNPPYFSVSRESYFKNNYFNTKFKTFTSTTDIYALFYEVANKTLRVNGLNSFIVSNKWMNANYGKSLRLYIVDNSNPLLIVDFNKVSVFSEATVFVSISLFQKGVNNNTLRGYKIEKLNKPSEIEFLINDNLIHLPNINSEAWRIIPPEVQEINNKITQKGTVLKEWDVSFYRGITTGANDAFLINQEKAESIMSVDVNSKSVIKKVLRGRNIKRYKYEYDNLNLLFIPWHFPLHQDDTIKEASELAETKFKKEYPGTYGHLDSYRDVLSGRNQAETGIRYEWYCLQRYGSSYYKLFEADKIVWLEISDKANYALDTDGMYLTNSAYFLVGKNLKYLLALLNSKLMDFYFFQITAQIAGGRKRYTNQYVEQLPIIDISETEQKPFVDLSEKILNLKLETPNCDTKELEDKIDQMVYNLYGLTKEQIAIVEKS